MEPLKRFVHCDKCGETLWEGGPFPCKGVNKTNEEIIENCGCIMKRWQDPVQHPAEDAFEAPSGSPWGSFDKLNRSEPYHGLMKPKAPEETQVGGKHYTKLAIQPMRYSLTNGLDAAQHTIIKYVTRFRDKGGIEDLEKAKHCIDLLIEFEREAGRA